MYIEYIDTKCFFKQTLQKNKQNNSNPFNNNQGHKDVNLEETYTCNIKYGTDIQYIFQTIR